MWISLTRARDSKRVTVNFDHVVQIEPVSTEIDGALTLLYFNDGDTSTVIGECANIANILCNVVPFTPRSNPLST